MPDDVVSAAVRVYGLGYWRADVSTRPWRSYKLGIGFVFVVAAAMGASPRQATPEAVSIDADDIGGVVTGPKGPRPASGSSPRRPTCRPRFVRIVVTDDRRPLCDPGPAEGQLQRLGARLRPGRFAEGAERARRAPEPDSGRRRQMPRAAAEYYPAGYWFSLLSVPDKGEFPGTGPAGNGIAAGHEEPGAVAADRQVGRMPRVPRAGHQGHA